MNQATTPVEPSPTAARFADLLEMTKPRITVMVALTAALGFFLSQEGPISYLRFLHAILGTSLLSSGASVLNQLIEKDTDALMKRTADRPLPGGRVRSDFAFYYGTGLCVLGLFELALGTNALTALLGAATLAGYVVIYTPMKKVSSLATLVGAVPGAIPPMMGWTAATGEIAPGAWALFGILFLWQLPHFLAIAWMYRTDYARGGFPMLPVVDPTGKRTGRQAVLWGAALIPVSLAPSALDLTGATYFVGALALGLAFLGSCFAFARAISFQTARRVLRVSIVYLPVILIIMLIDRVIG